MQIYIPRNEAEYLRQYGSEESCQRHMYELRRNTRFVCPHCQNKYWREMKRVAAGGRPATWHRVCKKCGWQERPLAGTRLHGLKIRLQDFCKICWLAAGARRGFDVRLLRGPEARRLVLDLGSNRTYYRSVKLVRRVMAATLPKLAGKLELRVIQAGHPQARATHSQTRVGVLAEASGKKRVRTGWLSDASAATFKRWQRSVSVRDAAVKSTKPHVVSNVNKGAGKLEAWLDLVGWDGIDSRNLPDYLTEFDWRQTGRGTQGSRLVQLLRAALEHTT